jgi:hypothetical protein
MFFNAEQILKLLLHQISAISEPCLRGLPVETAHPNKQKHFLLDETSLSPVRPPRSKEYAMPSVAVIGSIVSLFSFLLTFILVPDVSFHPLIVRLFAAVIVLLLVGGYFLVVAYVSDQRVKDRQNRYQPGEEILTTAKPHKIIVVAPSVFLLLCGGVLLIVGITLGLVHPNVSLTIPSHKVLNAPDKVIQAKHYHIPAWEVPILLSLPFFYLVVSIWQRWKQTIWIVTNQNLLELQERSVILPWLGKVEEPYPLNQVVEVKDVAGRVGGMFGWSTLTAKIRVDVGQDDPTTAKFRFMPASQNFTKLLRQKSPALNASLQGINAPQGTPIAQTQPLPPTS